MSNNGKLRNRVPAGCSEGGQFASGWQSSSGSESSNDIKEQIEWASKNGKELPLNKDGSLNDVALNKMYSEREKKDNNENNKMRKKIHIDFDKDNILPKLDDMTVKKLGAKESKEVLLKSSVIKRNLGKHFDVSDETMQNIIVETLYNPIDIFPANPDNPNYYHLASFVEVEDKDGLKMGLVLLDIDISKDYFEIGHVYYVNGEGFEKSQNKAKKKD